MSAHSATELAASSPCMSKKGGYRISAAVRHQNVLIRVAAALSPRAEAHLQPSPAEIRKEKTMSAAPEKIYTSRPKLAGYFCLKRRKGTRLSADKDHI